MVGDVQPSSVSSLLPSPIERQTETTQWPWLCVRDPETEYFKNDEIRGHKPEEMCLKQSGTTQPSPGGHCLCTVPLLPGAVRGLPDGDCERPVRGRILGLPRSPFPGGSCSETSAGAARAQTSGVAYFFVPS